MLTRGRPWRARQPSGAGPPRSAGHHLGHEVASKRALAAPSPGARGRASGRRPSAHRLGRRARSAGSTRTCASQSRSTRGEGGGDEVAHGAPDARGDHVVAGLVGLQRQPRGAHDVGGVRPVAHRVEVAEHELVLEAELDRRGGARDLAREEVLGAARRLVVVGQPRAGEEPAVLAHRAHEAVGGELRHAVGRARAHRAALGLRALARVAEDLAARSRPTRACAGSTSRAAASSVAVAVAIAATVSVGSSHESGTKVGAARW